MQRYCLSCKCYSVLLKTRAFHFPMKAFFKKNSSSGINGRDVYIFFKTACSAKVGKTHLCRYKRALCVLQGMNIHPCLFTLILSSPWRMHFVCHVCLCRVRLKADFPTLAILSELSSWKTQDCTQPHSPQLRTGLALLMVLHCARGW